jgi:hypothetical protein
MKISYAITVCDEHVEIQRLIEFLLRHKRHDDEIVVLFDTTKQCTTVEDYLRSHSINGEFSWHAAEFKGHFADWKNRLTSLCSGDYIFNIDADEIPCTPIIESLPAILESNPETDAIAIPRVNTVEGMSQDHMQQWGWNVNAEGWINWPDYQWRVYRNNGVVRWKNRVHEMLEGFENYSHLPMEEDYALYHPKTIERQVRQNEYYNTL